MRTLLIIAATGLLAVALYVSALAFWLDREVLTSENFVASTVTALDLESSRDAMAEMIVDHLVEEYPLLMLLESRLVTIFSELLGTEALSEVIALVAVDVHQRIVTGDQAAIVVDLRSQRETFLSPLEAVLPQVAGLVPESGFASIEVIGEGALPNLVPHADAVLPVRFVALVVAAFLTGFLLWFVTRLATAVVLIGGAFMIAGSAIAAFVPGGRWLAIAASYGELDELLVTNVFSQFAPPLFLGASMFAVVGVVLVSFGIVMQNSVSVSGVRTPREG